MKRAVLQCSDVSSGFRNTLRRCASTSSHGASRFKSRSQTPHARKGFEQEVPIAPELRTLLSPEACGWLEGKPYKDKKGKRPLSAVFDGRRPSPPSIEKMTFDAMDTVSEVASDSFVGADEDMIAEESLHIPAGTLVEIRR